MPAKAMADARVEEAADEDPFASVRDKMEVPAGHVPVLSQILPGQSVTTVEVPHNLDKDRGFACFLHSIACADGIIVTRPADMSDATWNLDDYIAKAEVYAQLYELIEHRPGLIINIAKGRVRSAGMMLPSMSSVSLATPDATFGFPEVRLGGIPSIQGCALRKRVSDETMRRMMMLGDVMDAREAQKVGLVDFVGDVELELARLLYSRCAPKEVCMMYRPDVEKALAEEEEGSAAPLPEE